MTGPLKRLLSHQLSGVPEPRNSTGALQPATGQVLSLRREVLAAAEREAAEIVMTANDEVRRVVSRARRELLVLATQVQSVSRKEDLLFADPFEPTALESNVKVVGPAGNPRRVLDNARRDFDVLWEEAEALNLRLHPGEDQPLNSYFASEATPVRAVRQAPARVSERPVLFLPKPPATDRLFRPFVALFAVIGTVVLVATILWRGNTASALPSRTLAETVPTTAPPPPDSTGWQATSSDVSAFDALLDNSAATLAREEQSASSVFRADEPLTGLGGGNRPSAIAPPIATAPAVSPEERAPAPAVLTSSDSATPQAEVSQPLRAEEPSSPTINLRPEPEPESVEIIPGGRVDLVSSGQRWLDAYYRTDGAAMASAAAENLTIFDQRAPTERLPGGLVDVERTLEDVQLELVGDNAILSARMTERAEAGGRMEQHAALVSQMWIRRGGRWQLSNVRIVNAD
jgi:hypothetical protein